MTLKVKEFAKKEKKRKRPVQKVDSDLTGFFNEGSNNK
jgi:hypothetical protein